MSDAQDWSIDDLMKERKKAAPAAAPAPPSDWDPSALVSQRGKPTPAADPIARLKAGDESAVAEFDRLDDTRRSEVKRKVTEAGVRGYLEHYYGAGNVEDVGNGNYAIRRDGERPMLLEGAGDWWEELKADVRDIAPEVKQAGTAALGAMTGAALGGGVGSIPAAAVGAAAGGVAGRVGRQMESAALPGEDYPQGGASEAMDRVVDVAQGGAEEVAGPLAAGKVVGLGKAAVKALTPRAFLARKLATEAADEGVGRIAAKEAAEAYGDDVPMFLDEATRGPKALAKGAALRAQHPGVFREAAIKRAEKFTQIADAALDQVGAGKNAEEAGRRFVQARNAKMEQMVADMKAGGDEWFGLARDLAGNRKVVTHDSALAAIDDELGKHGKTGTAALRELRDMLKSGTNIETLQNQLSRLGLGTKGSVELVSTLDRDANAAISKRVFAAMMDDLDKAAATPLVGRGPGGKLTPEAAGEAARVLQGARKAYAEAAQEIEAQRTNTLAQLVKRMAGRGQNVEQLAAEDLTKTHGLAKALSSKALSDGDVATVLKAADEFDKGAAGDIRRAVLEDLLSGAKIAADTTEARRGVRFDPAVFVKAFETNKERIAAVVGERSPQFAAMKKLADKSQMIAAATKGRKALGSQEAAMEQLLAPAIAATGGVVTGDPSGAVAGAAAGGIGQRLARALVNPERLARVWTDPRQSMMLLRLVEPPPKATSQITGRTAAQLLALVGEEYEESTARALAQADQDESMGAMTARILRGGKL